MNEHVGEFLKIAQVELEELIEDVDIRLKMLDKRLEESGVSEHVYFENRSLLQNELCCFRHFLKAFRQADAGSYGTVEDAHRDLLEKCGKDIVVCGYAPCALLMAERRLRKAARYATENNED